MLWDIYHCGPLDEILQLGVAELQADDIEEFVPLFLWCLVITDKLSHAHFSPFLSAYIHNVHRPTTACKPQPGDKLKSDL